MNPDIHKLQSYPFEKLAKLKSGITPPAEKKHISLSIGEPKHATPQVIIDALFSHMNGLSTYPSTKGIAELRNAIADWINKRFCKGRAIIAPESQVLPVNGTREALFAFAQSVIDAKHDALVMMPNPFYQIYEGAAYLAGATPYFMDCMAENGYLPDFDSITAADWQRCQLVYICSPGNPSGAVMSMQQMQQLIELSDQYDFVIASDECYSEIYFNDDQPPVGLIEACLASGRDDFKNCVIFHSLSKRSNAPGLRSGFVAGDADIIQQFFQYRTYHGCAMPVQHQHASIAAWNDETHVQENRRLYQKKFAQVTEVLAPVLPVKTPDAAFYLWIETGLSDEDFAQRLFAEQNVTVLPGSYLSREHKGFNPGHNHVRIALVADVEECLEAAQRIATFCRNLSA